MSIISEMNNFRNTLFRISHDWDNDPMPDSESQFVCWYSHKALSIITISINIATISASTTLFTASACTIGALKIAVFALTLGNITLPISTGCLTFTSYAFDATVGLVYNTGELIYDVGDLFYKAYRLTKYIAKAVFLNTILEPLIKKIAEATKFIFRQINRLIEFCANRFVAGIEKASESENASGNMIRAETIFPLNTLNNLTKNERIDFKSPTRSFKTIFKHYVYSVPNIILNTKTATVAACATLIFSSAFLFKATVYAATNVNIPVKTYAGDALFLTTETSCNAIKDVANDVADVFVVAYKATDALGVIQVAATVLNVIKYIPIAIFS